MLVYNTILIHTSQECNLCALQMSLSVYGVMSRLVYQCMILIAWKVSHHCVQKTINPMYGVIDMQCDPVPREMDKDQPRHDECKLLLLFNTTLIHTSQECNLCALQMSPSVYTVMSRLVYKCRILITWKVNLHFLQQTHTNILCGRHAI